DLVGGGAAIYRRLLEGLLRHRDRPAHGDILSAAFERGFLQVLATGIGQRTVVGELAAGDAGQVLQAGIVLAGHERHRATIVGVALVAAVGAVAVELAVGDGQLLRLGDAALVRRADVAHEHRATGVGAVVGEAAGVDA